MKRTTLFCLLSASIGAFAATAWHQTTHERQVVAQERGSLLRSIEMPAPPLPPARRPGAAPPTSDFRRQTSAPASGLDEFAPEERTNILVYDKANRSVV